jgi:ubiquinone/menaquinone biosynthesis C-methylase UbiE
MHRLREAFEDVLDGLVGVGLGTVDEGRPIFLGILENRLSLLGDFGSRLRETLLLERGCLRFGLLADFGCPFPRVGEDLLPLGLGLGDDLLGLGLGCGDLLENLLAGHSSPQTCGRPYKGVAKRGVAVPPTAPLWGAVSNLEEMGSLAMGVLEDKGRARTFYRYLSKVYDQVNKLVWTQEMRDEAIERLDIESGDRVLDVGCGTGFATEGLLKYTGEVVGLDQSVHQLEQAWQKLGKHDPVAFHLGDAERLPYATDAFDVGWSSGSIEYWPNPVSALEELRRVVRPGGKVLVVGPNYPQNRLARRLADSIMLFYDEAEADRMFREAGFTDIQHHVTGPRHWPSAAIVSVATVPDD